MTKELFAAGNAAVMEWVNSVSAGRYAQPAELATLGPLLASEDSSFSHGAGFVADRGRTIR